MKRLLYFVLLFAFGAVHAQTPTTALKVVDNGRTYYVNKPILGKTSDTQGLDYLLLHESYTGTLMPNMQVMGKITGTRGDVGLGYRRWTVEINTTTAYAITRGSLISYNEPVNLVTVVYNGKTYLAAEIANSSSLSNFSFTGYAIGETFQLVTTPQITSVAPFVNYDLVSIPGGLNLGIGNSSALLDIKGGSDWTSAKWKKSIRLYDSSGIEFANGNRHFALVTGGTYLYFSHSNPSGSEGLNHFMIADGNTGNVSIGGSMPPTNYKLVVEGSLGAKRVVVRQNGWADYVFHPDYQLPTLQEVEQFVTTEKHLEGIPSEKEVSEKGLDLGDFNKQLLKKVEELTLYMIQLNKNLDNMNQQVKDLNQQVAEQQKTISALQGK